ncbi:hypothetical protein [Streptomyces graminilatus]|uniref:hypothetical protein n=1 Tax=Streptomyces graminilatus TaxID=1464070 RepID=UPI0006E1833A
MAVEEPLEDLHVSSLPVTAAISATASRKLGSRGPVGSNVRPAYRSPDTGAAVTTSTRARLGRAGRHAVSRIGIGVTLPSSGSAPVGRILSRFRAHGRPPARAWAVRGVRGVARRPPVADRCRLPPSAPHPPSPAPMRRPGPKAA